MLTDIRTEDLQQGEHKEIMKQSNWKSDIINFP